MFIRFFKKMSKSLGDILLPVIYSVHRPLYFLGDNNPSSSETLDADSNVWIVLEPASTIWVLLLLILASLGVQPFSLYGGKWV